MFINISNNIQFRIIRRTKDYNNRSPPHMYFIPHRYCDHVSYYAFEELAPYIYIYMRANLFYALIFQNIGTSASAPLAAGIIALVLHANPSLNWRDVQHITVRCAHNANLKATDWSKNSVGRNFSHSFGYGIMDASCMVSNTLITSNARVHSTNSYFIRKDNIFSLLNIPCFR